MRRETDPFPASPSGHSLHAYSGHPTGPRPTLERASLDPIVSSAVYLHTYEQAEQPLRTYGPVAGITGAKSRARLFYSISTTGDRPLETDTAHALLLRQKHPQNSTTPHKTSDRQDKTRQDKTRQDKTRQDKTRRKTRRKARPQARTTEQKGAAASRSFRELDVISCRS